MGSLIGLISIVVVVVFESCSGCSQSGLNNSKRNKSNIVAQGDVSSRHGKTVLKMEKSNGVYLIPIEVNGVRMSFIFDTGAGLISISATEAAFLYKQGKLKDEDFIGKANFVDANGDISEGTIIILRTIKNWR
jgi:aspartyl protease family protein